MQEVLNELQTFDTLFRKTIQQIHKQDFKEANRSIKFAIGSLNTLMNILAEKKSTTDICKV